MAILAAETKKEPIILGIESSCDETAAAIIRGRKILSDEIASSASVQAEYGGVVPEIASRAHVVAVDKVVAAAIEKAHIKPEEIDAVAVTYGAGLLGALLVGVSFAKAYAYTLQKPLIAVNHIRGHLAAAYLADPALKPPFVTLLASGGHTAILYARSETEFSYLGGTKDDAAAKLSIRLRAFWACPIREDRIFRNVPRAARRISRFRRCSKGAAATIFRTAA